MPSPFRRWRQQDVLLDWAWILAFTGLALILFTVNLGGPILRDWDEGTVAQVAREIWRSPGLSGWLHPTVFGTPYANKPPLLHGLIALAYHFGGVNEWTARLPGALLTAVSVPILYGIGRQLWPTRLPAIFSTTVYLTLLPVVRHGRMAMLDGAILCFFLGTAWAAVRSRRDTRWALGIGLGMGLMCLTKGILGLLLGGLLLVFLLWDTPRLGRSPYLWGGILLGLAPAEAWYVNQILNQAEGFFQASLIDQSLKRVWSPVEDHRQPPYYYLLELLEWAWPWLLFWPWGLRQAWQERWQSWSKLVLVWTVGYLGAITLMQTKLPWYIMPLYPAMALAIGPVLADAWHRGGGFSIKPYTPGRYPRGWGWGLGVMAIAALSGLLYLNFWDANPTPAYNWPLAAVGIGTAMALGLLGRQDPQFIPVLAWSWLIGIALLMASPHWVLELNGWPGAKPMGEMVQQVPAGAVVYTTDRIDRPSVNFYGDRPVIPLCSLQLATHPFLPDTYVLRRLDRGEAWPGVTVKAIAATEGWQLVNVQGTAKAFRRQAQQRCNSPESK